MNRDGSGCHGAKRILLGPWLQRRLVSRDLPGYAQVSVWQVGTMLLIGIPAEVTTEAAQRIEAAALAAAPAGLGVQEARVISLANGFLQYLTTAEEYSAQFYEGGSTLYGPGSAALMMRTARELAAHLSDSMPRIPAVTIRGHPGKDSKIIPRPRISSDSAVLEKVECRRDTLIMSWARGVPGQWLDPAIPQISIRTTGPDTVVWDDDPRVEVRAAGRRGGLVRWEARWLPPRRADWDVVLPGGAASSDVTAQEACGPK